MAFFQLLLKARKLEKARIKYEDEKYTSIEISKGAKPKYTLKQRFRRKKLWLKKKINKIADKILSVPKKSWCYKKMVAIRTEGTLENFVATSFFGFIGGIFLTYMFFVFFVFQLNFKLSSATTLCTIIGVILTIGLAFSYRVRCIVFLLLPQFFSKRGRQALMAYAFVLALTGPVKNTLYNTGVLTESLTCAQEQLKEAVKSVVDLAKQPFYALRDAISKVIKSVKGVVKKIRQTLVAIKRLVLSILRVITSVFQWLGSVVNICNKKLGTPFDRCQRVFEGAVADCKAKLGPYFGVVCNLTYVVSALCYVVKPLDFICMLVSYVADVVVGAVRSKIKKFAMHMKAMFYVKVKFSHSFHFETNQSKTIEEVSTGITTEIRSRTKALFGFFDWMSCVTSLFVFIILLRVLRYRYKWLTSERFDNRYITDDLRKIDLIRARQDKETVLPLNRRERNRYVPLSSVMLIKPEKLKLTRSVVFLGLATIKLASYMIIDYSLYWVLNTIQVYGRYQSRVERPNVVSIHVSGEGYLADLYRSIVKAFTPQGKETEIDTMLCLPMPVMPNLDKYTQIIALIVFCWLMTFLEPYGLRLRQVVMCRYYPDRAKQRAVWLYNHIIRSRGSFLKFARRQLRRKFGLAGGEKIEKVTLRERLLATSPCLRFCFPQKQNMCLMCGAPEREDESHIKCPTPGCIGLYCPQCFAELQNLCTICRHPVEYGDLSDISEEKDSSEDEFPVFKPESIESEEMEEEMTFEDEEETVEESYEMEEEQSEEPEEVEEEQTEEPEEVEEEQIEEGEKVDEEQTEEQEEEEEKEAEVEEEEKVKEDEKPEKEVALQTDEKYEEESDESSKSSYSYTYQDESPQEIEVEKRREPFKDVEAQKIRDDVTIQIFNEPFVRDVCSSCESPSGFVVRARRKIRARVKKRPEKDSDSSTSIADTESWSTEEIDEEEVIHIEMYDSSEELLPRDRRDKEKRGRINKIVSAVARIPWLGRGECSGLQRKRPSLMKRIVSMLHRKQSMPIQSYRRCRKTKGSPFSSISCDDENEALLSRDDRRLAGRKFKRRRITDEFDEMNMRHPYERRFTTERLPRCLESAARSMSYFEVDETEDSQTARKCARQVEDINKLSSRASSDSKNWDTWNITEDDELLGPCTCTSKIVLDPTRGREILEMSSTSEYSGKRARKREIEDTTNVSASETDYTDDTESIEVLKKSDDVQGAVKRPDLSKHEEPVIRKKKLDDKVQDKTESKTKEEDTAGFLAHNPLASLKLYSLVHKSKENLEEPEKAADTIEKTQNENDRNEKESKKNDGEGEIKETEEATIDKSTDLRDRNRSTQTKLHSRDKDMKGKHAERVLKASKESRKMSKELDKKKKKHRRRHNPDEPGTSKRRKHYYSKEPTLFDDEEFYEDEELPPDPERKQEKYEECQESERWGSHENIYSLYDSRTLDADRRHPEHYYGKDESPCRYYPRDYEDPRQDPRDINIRLEATKQRFEMPMVKKYLPMYQSPELIEELKKHDRIKLIREEEARRRRIEASPDSISTCSRIEARRTDRSIVCDYLTPSKVMKEGDTLPYQDTQAYRKVLSEFRRRTGRQRSRERSDSIPLMRLSKKADKSKQVELLYPPRDRSRRKSEAVKKFAKRIIAPFKQSVQVVPCEKRRHTTPTRSTLRRKVVACPKYSHEPDFSDVSSVCSCSKQRSNESTDSNESPH